MTITDNTQFGRVGAFRFWCQKVLPAVYDDSLSYYELLCKVTKWLEDLTEITNTQSDAITELQETLAEFMAGTFDPYIEQKVDEWFDENQPQIILDIANLNDRVDNLEDDFDERMDALEADFDSIKPYWYYDGYNMVVIGDSYAAGSGASDHGSGDTNRFSSVLANMLGATEFNFAVGSTGFCDPGSGGQNAPFETQVLTASSSMSAEERANTHLVIIAGGINDFHEGTYSGAQMRSASNRAASNALAAFPNANILVVPMLFKGWGIDARAINYANRIIEGVASVDTVKRVRYVDGAWTWNFGRMSQFNGDHLHPNDSGHKTIAGMIYSHIDGGSAYQNQLMFMNFFEGYSSTTDTGGYLQFMNGNICCHGIIVNIDAEATTGLVQIGTVDEGVTPLVNIYAPIYHGNEQVGDFAITESGNMYINVHTVFDTRFFINPFSYVPRGRY